MKRMLFTVVMLAVPRLALACPVCFGQNDSPLGIAMNNGIMLMLGVVVAVLACFASFFIYLMRRARLADNAEGAFIDPAEAGHYDGPGKTGHYLKGQEG